MEEITKLKAEAFELMMEVEKAKVVQEQCTRKVNEILKTISELEKPNNPVEVLDAED